jgi:hypothetical protein
MVYLSQDKGKERFKMIMLPIILFAGFVGYMFYKTVKTLENIA